MFDPEINKALQRLSDQLSEAHPEIEGVLTKLRAGDMGKLEAMQVLMTLTKDNPDLVQSIQTIGEQALASTRQEITLAEEAQEMLVEVDGQEVPVLTQTGPGLPSLNPHYEAALIERLQFDEDIPEARTAPLPPGHKPAVPVETKSRNMAAIGHMLETASEEVMGELAGARQKAIEDMQGELDSARLIGEGFHKTAEAQTNVTSMEDWEALKNSTDNVVAKVHRGAEVAIQKEADQKFIELIKRNEPKGYRTGRLPTRRSVQEPPGGFLASMTPEDKREATWKALSTTQGRRTALGGVTEIIAQGLASEGVELVVKSDPSGRLSAAEEVVAYEEWTVMLAGPKATQSQFAFIDNAAKALLAKLVKHDLRTLPPSARLDVLPINTVNVNQVGWATRIVVHT